MNIYNISLALDVGVGDGKYLTDPSPQQDRVFGGLIPQIKDPSQARQFLENFFNAGQKKTQEHIDHGSTGTVVITTPGLKVTAAHLGDSPAFLVGQTTDGQWHIKKITKDHSAEALADEINANGGNAFHHDKYGFRNYLVDERNNVHGGIQVGAGFGDRQFSGSKRNPDIVDFTFSEDKFNSDRCFVVVMSDGVHDEKEDTLNEDQILSVIQQAAENPEFNPQLVAYYLVEEAKRIGVAVKGSDFKSDNLSVTVTHLDKNKSFITSVFDGHGSKHSYGDTTSELLRDGIAKMSLTQGLVPALLVQRAIGQDQATIIPQTIPVVQQAAEHVQLSDSNAKASTNEGSVGQPYQQAVGVSHHLTDKYILNTSLWQGALIRSKANISRIPFSSIGSEVSPDHIISRLKSLGVNATIQNSVEMGELTIRVKGDDQLGRLAQLRDNYNKNYFIYNSELWSNDVLSDGQSRAYIHAQRLGEFSKQVSSRLQELGFNPQNFADPDSASMTVTLVGKEAADLKQMQRSFSQGQVDLLRGLESSYTLGGSTQQFQVGLKRYHIQ